ncbi:hypothetical protein MIMGU_mgv1a014877mg [Erythranthe guttata]|uniref:F-box/LRR-repeat protein 15/At3g58940/PEG3-like LRR domain-containing protein n=1 Tax=Erythranthe guttata TaxID=4155 RepID=A0A022PR30_ERYGU|nr:hypothetical protein MIMGU_mgv1a014877mg [Erythranthe guttata]
MKMSAVSKDFYDFWAKSEVLTIKIKDMEPNKLRVMFEKNILEMLHRRKIYGVPLTRCTIALHSLVSSTFVTEVLHCVVDSNVKHLHVQAFTGFFTPCARFPSSINCSSLTTLCIKDVYGESFELPKSVILPNLKVLRLHDFEFSNDNYNGAIFEGCPNLQKLVIVKCRMKFTLNL